MAGNPINPLETLSAALAAPADSKEQADLLATLRESLEAHPNPIPVLCTTLIRTVSNASDTLLKRWVLDLLHFAICRSTLSLEARTQLASQSVETLAGLLNDRNPQTVKVAIQCFATVYPLLFRSLCVNRNPQHQWDILSQAKIRILDLVWSTQASNGVKLSAIKFMQRAILVQTRGINDPRLQNRNDPNISLCPTDHPFIPVGPLEAEGLKLLEGVITMLYTNQNPDILSAILNSWANLVKLRPVLVELVVSTLSQWTPTALSGLPALSVKSVEKGIRILLIHIMRTPQGSAFAPQIQGALSTQAQRMEKAAAEEKQRKLALAESKKRSLSAIPDGPDAKRPKLEPDVSAMSAAFLSGFDFTTLPSTLVTDLIIANLQAFTEPVLAGLVHNYRIGRKAGIAPSAAPPVNLVDPALPISSTSLTTPTTPTGPIRAASPPSAPRTIPTGPRAASKSVTPVPEERPITPPTETQQIIVEAIDPLKMDIDDEDIEYEPDKLNQELSGGQEAQATEIELALDHEMDLTLDISTFKLPAPKEFSDDSRDGVVRGSLVRIWDGAKDLASQELIHDTLGMSPADMWMLLLVRLVTRVADPAVGAESMDSKGTGEGGELVSDIYSHQDRLRQTLCDYIIADFPGRLQLATTWMNEEWYNDRVRSQKDPNWRPNYETWLNQIVSTYETHLDNRDRTFSHFILDLPAIPQDVMSLLREMCVEPERRQVGFSALREFVTQRPSLRNEAMTMLLELTTHPEKAPRGAAINTIKRWIPDAEPMTSMIREFALQLLRRLQATPKQSGKSAEQELESENPQSPVGNGDILHESTETPETNGAITLNGEDGEEREENMEDGQLPQEDILQTPYLPEQLALPAQKDQILQHVELLFVLSTKVPEFLDEIFEAYSGMETSVQGIIQELITPLIRALGSSHGKLLTLLRTFSRGAESLALRVLTIFTESGRPSGQLVALVKGLIAERNLDARFLIPIIAEMDKADILRHLPRIVSILNGKPEPKNLVRSVFSSVVTTPPQSFGSVTSNLPRVRQSELLTPAELMVLLHESEKEIGMKAAMEAIGICFSMTDIYRSDILAVVMNQLVDEPVLPTLFMRTVIQAVTTYRSLTGFVSGTVLTRLITKKVWTTPQLWQGFIHCAKAIAPASYPSLMQLPKEHLRDVLDKQPSLKSGLREYLMKKGGNKKMAGLLDIFGQDENTPNKSDSPAAETTPLPESGTGTPAPS